jgi:hypothetical protein
MTAMTMLGVLAWSWSEIAIPGPMSELVQRAPASEAMCVLTGGSLIAELLARMSRQTRVEVMRSVPLQLSGSPNSSCPRQPEHPARHLVGSPVGVCNSLRLTSPSQQCPDAVQLAVRDAQALPELHAACPGARLHAELLHPRCEPLRTMLGGHLRAVSRMAQAADLHVPPARALGHFDLDFHRSAPLVEGVRRRVRGPHNELTPSDEDQELEALRRRRESRPPAPIRDCPGLPAVQASQLRRAGQPACGGASSTPEVFQRSNPSHFNPLFECCAARCGRSVKKLVGIECIGACSSLGPDNKPNPTIHRGKP